MSDAIPAVLQNLIDDAAVFPPGNAALEDAVPAHRGHRQSWYEPMVGPLLVPASRLGELRPGRTELRIGVIVDVEPEQVAELVDALDGSVTVAQYESRAALHHLVGAAKEWEAPVFAELPFGEDGLDAVVGTGLVPKFRTGGPSAEFFPPPEVLAAVMVGCARRGLRFKLTAGLHRAVRHRDAETGFVHHGFLNVLAASAEASGGADEAAVAAILASTDAEELADRVRAIADRPRLLWSGFGSCSIMEPLEDLMALSLLRRGGAES
ncbi:hypothetical protein [Glycomyces arizonensis]|uniref:hypothetical protein n=1 Tax=Glycomyces arizonensis TaxID=256035 RepID=UPI00047DDBE4|nr:hypothetical protein [Glycomyces arizonensis]